MPDRDLEPERIAYFENFIGHHEDPETRAEAEGEGRA